MTVKQLRALFKMSRASKRIAGADKLMTAGLKERYFAHVPPVAGTSRMAKRLKEAEDLDLSKYIRRRGL